MKATRTKAKMRATRTKATKGKQPSQSSPQSERNSTPEPEPVVTPWGARLELPTGRLDVETIQRVTAVDAKMRLVAWQAPVDDAKPPSFTVDFWITNLDRRRQVCRVLATEYAIAITDRLLLSLLHLGNHEPEPEPSSTESEPEPEPVDPAIAEAEAQAWRDRTSSLLDAVEQIVRHYVGLTEPQAIAVVLWVANTHVYDLRGIVPFLNIISAVPESGKTRLFEAIESMVRVGRRNVNMSEAVLFRLVDAFHPTLLLDEVEAIFGAGPKSESVQRIAGMHRAGYKRGAFATRCETETGTFEPRDFDVFCPRAFAGARDVLDPALRGRCITIYLRKRREDEPVGDFFHEEFEPWGQALGATLATWATHARTVLKHWHPTLPDGMRDRRVELWRPLKSIAEMGGDRWAVRCASAIRALETGATDSADVRLVLLSGMRDVFNDRGDKVFTFDMIGDLIDRPDDPFGSWWGKEWDDAKKRRDLAGKRNATAFPRKATLDLSRHLRAFDILTKTVRIGDVTGRGLDRRDFEDAFARYLPAPPSTSGGTTRNSDTPHGAQGFAGVSEGFSENVPKHAENHGAQGLSRCFGKPGTNRSGAGA